MNELEKAIEIVTDNIQYTNPVGLAEVDPIDIRTILNHLTGVCEWTQQGIFESTDVWNSLKPLHSSIACSYYFWTDIAPEAVGLAFGIITSARLNFEDAVLGAVNIGRDTDTIAAIAGAICGAFHGIQSIPERWVKRISVSRGICINAVKNMNILDVADELALLAQTWSGKNE